jgi:hypothetical protein
MDCSTARLFLQLGRPGARDLDGPEAAALDEHLAACPTCHHFSLDQDRLDRRLGAAMRDVPVPAGLKEQVLLRLAADQGARQRRWAGRAVLGAAAAAAVVGLGVGLALLLAPNRPTISAEAVLQGANITRADSEEKANAQLRALRALPGAPTFLNYAYLKGGASLAVLPGTEVQAPQLVFTNGEREAIVYFVPRGKYQLEELGNPAQGYKYQLDVHRPDPAGPVPDCKYVYLVLHTGENWDWLRVAPRD